MFLYFEQEANGKQEGEKYARQQELVYYLTPPPCLIAICVRVVALRRVMSVQAHCFFYCDKLQFMASSFEI